MLRTIFSRLYGSMLRMRSSQRPITLLRWALGQLEFCSCLASSGSSIPSHRSRTRRTPHTQSQGGRRLTDIWRAAGRGRKKKRYTMAANTPITSSSGGGGYGQMDKELVKAASHGDSALMKKLALRDPRILFGKTPERNNCLHIASIHGHLKFCTDVLEMERRLLLSNNANHHLEPLLSKFNLEWEAPLVIAVTRGHVELATFLLECCHQQGLSRAILGNDRYGFNVLHHAIRSGHEELALDLISKAPELSRGLSKFGESPMYVAVMRDFTHVFEKLVEIPDSAHGGKNGRNALHAAARNGNSGIAEIIMDKRPGLAREPVSGGNTPVMLAVMYAKVDVLRVLLEIDPSLGYQISNKGNPPLCVAASRGHVDVATELLKHCPDALYLNVYGGWTCLHEAVWEGHTDFVKFILKTKQLQKVVNMQDSYGKTALHLAVRTCNPTIVEALLSHKGIDTAVLDNNSVSAARELSNGMHHVKTLNWNEVCMRMSKADPKDATAHYNLHVEAKQRATFESRRDAKSLTITYTTNTSLVAILMTTITFAAAFTLPGGYSSGAAGSEGLPIMSRKSAFQAFLIFDTLAMCSSFVVAFICIIAKWEDYEFLIHYISITTKLMWFAYVATTTAFSASLYTVLAPRVHWLAITICVLVASLPIITWLVGKWPVLKLQYRLRKTFNRELLEMV